jgi:hypothetical protein
MSGFNSWILCNPDDRSDIFTWPDVSDFIGWSDEKYSTWVVPLWKIRHYRHDTLILYKGVSKVKILYKLFSPRKRIKDVNKYCDVLKIRVLSCLVP